MNGSGKSARGEGTTGQHQHSVSHPFKSRPVSPPYPQTSTARNISQTHLGHKVRMVKVKANRATEPPERRVVDREHRLPRDDVRLNNRDRVGLEVVPCNLPVRLHQYEVICIQASVRVQGLVAQSEVRAAQCGDIGWEYSLSAGR